ncbi:hypothetical protein DFH06DRAFT_1340739 [Mycena polygramma]|nr:hypothetical protein DFH06DRAFT_1340739 [Mycena polygramma]
MSVQWVNTLPRIIVLAGLTHPSSAQKSARLQKLFSIIVQSSPRKAATVLKECGAAFDAPSPVSAALRRNPRLFLETSIRDLFPAPGIGGIVKSLGSGTRLDWRRNLLDFVVKNQVGKDWTCTM